ncbi:DUF4247 domain-containing protein [Streptomyces sp. NPDC002328]|uniref:DUF4247 domain-containing protein n=1 Tax=Streptomyces sp. NPDC002328 TaxID=3364642 RepID=UPI0036B1DCE9
MKSARLVRTGMAAALSAVLLTACSSSDGQDGVPLGWIKKTYTANGAAWLDRCDAPTKVADEIHDNRKAIDRASGGRMEFLRYGDDMVTVSPYGCGSRIEVEDYRNGYRRHSQHLGLWPDPNSASFRGGGPGEGK